MFLFENVIYKTILNIKSLKISSNKVTCIIGESGAGKSTLLKLLNKIISYDSGTILYNEKSLKEINSLKLRREVVMLPQTSQIYPGTIRENLLIGIKFQEKTEVADNILLEMLKFIKLDKELDDDAAKLSGGEKQRLALARIILIEPDVFLLDEPSSALDDETSRLIFEKLVEYTKKNNKTLIMVTHSKRIANEFADEVIEIHKGKVVI